MDPGTRRELGRFLAEDIGSGDVTGSLLPRRRISGRIRARQACTVSGAAHAGTIFRLRGCRAVVRVRDGRRARAGQAVLDVSGPAAGVLSAERTALNLMSRMSGIATQTRRLSSMLPPGTRLYATRKTAPGLRRFDKEAVVAGGGMKHRMGLYDGVMIKDNHLAAAPLEELMRRAKRRHTRIEVEADTVAGAVAAVQAGATTVLLDNFTPAQARSAVRRLERLGLRRRARIEISGGVTESNIRAYARAGADMISSGGITSSAPGIDFGLDV